MSDNLETCIEPYLPAFEQTYAAENYTARTIITYRCRARKFGALLDQAGIAPSSVTLDCIEALMREVPRARKNTIRLDTIARRLVQHLIDIGVAQPVPFTEAEIARAALLTDFETYLVKQRGLSPRSIPHTVGFARRFLDYRFGKTMPDTACLRPADAIGFMEHVLISARRDKTVATHVRIFLQYLFGCGATATNLALSVPKVAKVWGARLPRHLSPEGVEAVLACVRDNPRHGARDYAMLLFMARLGLRAAEVIAIQLGDIDWRSGELTVRGKGKLHDRLPITVEVGDYRRSQPFQWGHGPA